MRYVCTLLCFCPCMELNCLCAMRSCGSCPKADSRSTSTTRWSVYSPDFRVLSLPIFCWQFVRICWLACVGDSGVEARADRRAGHHCLQPCVSAAIQDWACSMLGTLSCDWHIVVRRACWPPRSASTRATASTRSTSGTSLQRYDCVSKHHACLSLVLVLNPALFFVCSL